MTKKWKIIIVVSGIILAGVVGVGFYMYNKGPLNVRNRSGIAVKAIDLYHMYSSDSTRGNEIYGDKILEVTGVLKSAGTNDQEQQLVLLDTGNEGASINCILEESAPAVKPGDKITVKGICSGIGQGEPELGILADVYLSRCYVLNN